MVSKNTILRKAMLTCSVLALIGLSSGSVMAQADKALHDSLSISMRDAVATGVATNPEYGVVAASRRATDEELEQGRALFLSLIHISEPTRPY